MCLGEKFLVHNRDWGNRGWCNCQNWIENSRSKGCCEGYEASTGDDGKCDDCRTTCKAEVNA